MCCVICYVICSHSMIEIQYSIENPNTIETMTEWSFVFVDQSMILQFDVQLCVCACVLMFERDLDTVSVFRFLFMYVRTFSSILFESKTAYKRSYNVFDIFSTKFHTISFFHPSKINLKNWIMKTKVSTHLVRNCSNFPVSDSNGIDIHTKNAHTKVECIAHKFFKLIFSISTKFQQFHNNKCVTHSNQLDVTY